MHANEQTNRHEFHSIFQRTSQIKINYHSAEELGNRERERMMYSHERVGFMQTTHHICVAESVQAHLDECAILFMQAHRGRRIYLKVLRGRTSKFIIISAHKSVKCRRYIWGMMPCENMCEIYAKICIVYHHSCSWYVEFMLHNVCDEIFHFFHRVLCRTSARVRCTEQRRDIICEIFWQHCVALAEISPDRERKFIEIMSNKLKML